MSTLVRWTLAVACASLLGCGFLGADGEDGTPVADGLAPFGGDERVGLCVEGARIEDATRPPGLCRAEGHEPSACEVDADCALPEACVCGSCTAKLCEASSDCPEGAICAGTPRRCLLRCERDDECGYLGVCESGTCLRACADQSECAVGELCLAARCQAIACGPGGPNCGPGEVCAHQLFRAMASGPSVLRDGEQLVLFASIEDTTTGEASIYRFVSRDGALYFAEPPTPVLSPAVSGATRFDAPSVVRTEQGLRIFYEVDGGLAVESALDPSGDGLSFGASEVVLTPAEAWEGARVGAPSAAVVEGQLVLAYEGGEGAGIGFALESAGGFANAPAPTLVPGDLEDPERFAGVTEVRDPFLHVAEAESGRRVLRLYVAAMGVALPANAGGTFDAPNYSIAVAGAVLEGDVDGLVLAAHGSNPVYGRVQNFRPQDETGPSLVHDGARYLLYFDASDGIRFAANPID